MTLALASTSFATTAQAAITKPSPSCSNLPAGGPPELTTSRSSHRAAPPPRPPRSRGPRRGEVGRDGHAADGGGLARQALLVAAHQRDLGPLRCQDGGGGKIQAAAGWSEISEAVGGNHFTLRSSRIAAPSRTEYSPSVQRHPRSGVGVTKDGRVLMVTVDGRQSGYSIGVTLAEMGQLMRSLGAVDAFNLDGGGSTVMARRVLRSGEYKVANRPSDGRQRPATQSIVAYAVDPNR